MLLLMYFFTFGDCFIHYQGVQINPARYTLHSCTQIPWSASYHDNLLFLSFIEMKMEAAKIEVAKIGDLFIEPKTSEASPEGK